MMNLMSLAIAVVAVAQLWRPFLPFAGWSGWMVIPLALMGLGVGALSERTLGRDLNIFLVVVSSILLLLRAGPF
ncbi:MAG: hypothetical protein MUE77_11635 [Sandarakinorhabdus sp.]|jgi:hypothetical protein|nr:hypothetical protein [Sandarakinorhabdus sp.]